MAYHCPLPIHDHNFCQEMFCTVYVMHSHKHDHTYAHEPVTMNVIINHTLGSEGDQLVSTAGSDINILSSDSNNGILR